MRTHSLPALLAPILALNFASGALLAQCPTDDANEPNDGCSTALPGTIGTTSSLIVTGGSEDWWTFAVPAAGTISIDVSFISVNGDIDLTLFRDSGTCASTVDRSDDVGNTESVTWFNNTGAASSVTMQVYLFSSTFGTCNDYSITASLVADPCLSTPDDTQEPNDTCSSAVLPSLSYLQGLFLSKTDEDFYTYNLSAGELLGVDVFFTSAGGELDLQLLDGSNCTTVLREADSDWSAGDFLNYGNNTGAAQTVILRVFIDSNAALDCNNYELMSASAVDPCLLVADDSMEPNDTCANPASIPTGLTSGLRVLNENVDQDWYSVNLPPGANLTVDALFVHSAGDIDLMLFDSCGGTMLDSGQSLSDDERVQYANVTGLAQQVLFSVYVDGSSYYKCNDYDLNVDIQGGVPLNIVPYCFGDGSGTGCPCGNNSTAGHPGGCFHSNMNGAILSGSGLPSVSSDTLRFDLTMAPADSFGLLVSGDQQLPGIGNCIGCGLVSFDGLRCAGGNFLRHGVRATSAAGTTPNGWGPPGAPSAGLISANGFVAGETRNFFVYFRTNPTTTCLTGQNSSNGVSVTFAPKSAAGGSCALLFACEGRNRF